MSKNSIEFSIQTGAEVFTPLPLPLVEAVRKIEVVHNDSMRSGFQIEFAAGRNGIIGKIDYPQLKNLALKLFNRIKLVIIINTIPRKIMDGIITNVQLNPSNEPGASTIVVTGEDIGLLLDREEKIVKYPAQNDFFIVGSILKKYKRYNLTPFIIPPSVLETPMVTDRIPIQHGTDLDYLQQLAERYGYVFYIETGPTSVNLAYWGPPRRPIISQRALSVNLGPQTNVNFINFQEDSLAPKTYSLVLQDRKKNRILSVKTVASTRIPLARGALRSPTYKAQFTEAEGLNYQQARARLQAKNNYSRDQVVVAQGEIDVARYGGVLQARSLVGIRGAGESYDGLYYVKEVSHVLQLGQYKQAFTLTRDGRGATTFFVRP